MEPPDAGAEPCRAEFPTFEKYLEVKWNMSRPRAFQLMESAAIVSNLSTVVDKPTSERQVRPLVELDTKEEQVQAWRAANPSRCLPGQGNLYTIRQHLPDLLQILPEVKRPSWMPTDARKVEIQGLSVGLYRKY
jgi:hypothetical protein